MLSESLKHRYMTAYGGVLVLFFIFLIGCSKPDSSEVLRVGYSDEPPFAQLTREGQVEGVFPEALKRITTRLGYERVEWVLMPFDRLIPALRDQRIDLIANGMTATAQRARHICFTRPLVATRDGFLWLKEGSQYSSQRPIDTQGLTYAVIAGSVEERWLEQEVSSANILSLEDIHHALLAVDHKKADILVLPLASLHYLAANGEGRYQIGEAKGLPSQRQFVSFAIRKQQKALLERWNREQASLQATQPFQNHAETAGFETTIQAPANPRECYQQ